MKQLTEKIVLITGAGSGIGRETALLMAQHGATLVLAGRRIEPLEAVAEEVRELDGQVRVRSVDLEDGEAAAGLGRWTLEQFGRVDVLVNNAGHSSKTRSIRYVGTDDWQSVFAVNVEGVYRLTQSLIESMIAKGEGTVITVSSMAALKPGLLGGAPYSAAKAASRNLMGDINAELNDLGIRACTIVPAEVDTPILDNRPLIPDEESRATMMHPRDIADAILLCAVMPQRTEVEEIVLKPTTNRNVDRDIDIARREGE